MAKGTFWANQNIEPKRPFQFKVLIGDIPYFLGMSASRPSMTINTHTHNYLNLEFKFPGRVKFEDITVKLVDTIDDNAVVKLKEILDASGYGLLNKDTAVGPSYLKSISRKRAIEALQGGADSKGLILEHLDSEGEVIETWTLKNAWISAINFSDLDFDQEDISNVELTITYDWPIVEPVER